MITLNRGQQIIVDEADHWYNNSSEQVFQYAGNPGTGKSLVLNAIIDRLKVKRNRIAPMSFIGAAAIVMRLKGLANARTIHSWIYSPVSTVKFDDGGNIVINEYFDRPMNTIGFQTKPLDDIDLIVIDEAGAVPYSLKKDIEDKGIKIIACGDLDQLPPVGDKPAYLFEGKVYILDEIMRQAGNSGIIYLSQRAKVGLPIHNGLYNNVLVINEDELSRDMILRSDIILCNKNVTRSSFNDMIRQDLLGINNVLPLQGEKLICRKNNRSIQHDGINLANGLVGMVTNSPDVGGFDGDTFSIDFMPNMLQTPFKDILCDYKYFSAEQSMREKLKHDKYNIGEKFEFAYAITTHLSQGSEYANGIYLEEYLNPNINKNLNYTGITRFSNFLIYVKPKRKFY